MTSSNGNIFRVTGHLCGEFTGSGEFPAQRPVTRSFDVFFDLHPNKRLSKQWWGWWFETPSCPFWRLRNVQHLLDIPAHAYKLNLGRHSHSGLPNLDQQHSELCYSVHINVFWYISFLSHFILLGLCLDIFMNDMLHYSDVIMDAIVSQITSLTIVYSTVYSDADQRKHQSSESLAFVRVIHSCQMNSPQKWPVTCKMFPFDGVIMLTDFHNR